ncbi:MAG TPA: hypothetical protein VGS19_35670 [Streptosporangiaceae bacterium]|nr:hypothetical protein [Streptosporangiaceae bacterium]
MSKPAGSAALPATSSAAATTPAVARPLPGDRPHELTWILTRYALGQLVADPAVRAGLSRSHVYQLLQPGEKPLAWATSTPVVDLTATSELTQAVSRQQLPSGAGAVLYDPEAWPFTPAYEQRNPVAAADRAKAVAQSHGLLLIAAPALDLVTVHKGGRGPDWQRFLHLHLIGAMASNVNVIELQAQSLERDAGVYTQFVRQAVAQARAVDPQVQVFAGLSTNPSGAPVTSGQLVDAIKATERMVNGYWLNIPGRGPRCPTCNTPRPDIGRAALQAVL